MFPRKDNLLATEKHTKTETETKARSMWTDINKNMCFKQKQF